MEIGRVRIVQQVDEMNQGRFRLGRALQQQLHVVEGQCVGNHSAIILGIGFGARIAGKFDRLAFVDGLDDEPSGCLGRGIGCAADCGYRSQEK